MPRYDAELFDPPVPVAHVTLRHPQTRATLADVPMLIDSGADVTLVPQSSLNALGAAIEAGDGYELLGFDGSKSVAHASQIELLFLRRAFKGRFLLIEGATGILGRDVLNHLPIVLDGPGLAWHEHKGSDGKAGEPDS